MSIPSEGTPPTGGSQTAGRLITLFFGLAMILLGGLLLVGQVLHINIGSLLWPFFIIAPGVALFVLALAIRGNGGEALAIVGGILSMVGLLLFVQNATGLWATWAYAWALIAPTSIGLAQLIYGAIKGRKDLVKSGMSVAGVGLTMFLVAGAFFELVLGVSGFGLGPLAFPALLIGLGVILVAVNVIRGLRA